MQEKKNSNAKRLIISTILCALIILLAKFALSLVFGQSTAQLEKENKSLKSEYSQLKTYVDNNAIYLKQINEYTDNIIELIGKCKKLSNDKITVHEVETWLSKYKMAVSSMSFASTESEMLDVIFDGVEYRGFSTPLSFSYNMPYNEFKKFITEIKDNNKDIAINSFTMSADAQNSTVTGSMSCTIFNFTEIDAQPERVDVIRESGTSTLFPDSKVGVKK